MIKYNEVKLTYTCPAFPPEGIFMNRSYRIVKKDNILFVTDGNKDTLMEELLIKMLFSPQEKDITWINVDFKEEIVPKKK